MSKKIYFTLTGTQYFHGKDFLEKENIGFEKFLKDAGIPVKFMDAVSADGRDMFHVYPIANPTWPEGEKTIQMISDNANGR